MLRIVLAAAALATYLPTQFLLGSSHLQQPPSGQSTPYRFAQGGPEWREAVKPGIAVFEDKFTGDSGGWTFGSGLVLAAPGAKLECDSHSSSRIVISKTHIGWYGVFSAEVSFPADAAPDTAFGVAFWVMNDESFWVARVFANGRVDVVKVTRGRSSIVWETSTSNLVKTMATDVNALEAKAAPGSVTIVLNGKTLGSFFAEALGFNFGLYSECPSQCDPLKSACSSQPFTVHSYKVATP